MNVLVTGATGFIGRHLCRELLSKDFNVIALVRSHEDAGKTNESIKSFTKSLSDVDTKKLQIISCDISDNKNLVANFERIGQVDCVFHLAGQTLRKDLTDPQIYHSNFIGTLNILECCRIFNINKLVFSSSMAVYGLSVGQFLPKYLPVDESHDVNPFDFYDLSKYLAEQACKYYHDRFGICSVILRYSRVYGPDMKKGFIFQSIKNAIAGDTLEVSGNVSTDFVFIDDVVAANIASFEQAMPGFEIFNIGSGEEITLYEICSKIIELTDSSSQIKIHQGANSKFSLSISKARTVLSFSPIGMEQGLIKCIDKIRNPTK